MLHFLATGSVGILLLFGVCVGVSLLFLQDCARLLHKTPRYDGRGS